MFEKYTVFKIGVSFTILFIIFFIVLFGFIWNFHKEDAQLMGIVEVFPSLFEEPLIGFLLILYRQTEIRQIISILLKVWIFDFLLILVSIFICILGKFVINTK